jgi:hypothetical protein
MGVLIWMQTMDSRHILFNTVNVDNLLLIPYILNGCPKMVVSFCFCLVLLLLNVLWPISFFRVAPHSAAACGAIEQLCGACRYYRAKGRCPGKLGSLQVPQPQLTWQCRAGQLVMNPYKGRKKQIKKYCGTYNPNYKKVVCMVTHFLLHDVYIFSNVDVIIV